MIEGLKTVSTILAIVSWSGIILFGTFVYFRFAPTIKLSIEPRWEGNNSEYLVIKFVAENKSRIRIYKPVFLAQIALYKECSTEAIGARLPLSEVEISKNSADYFIGPEQINSKNSRFYPGERIYWEKLYSIPENVKIAHIINLGGVWLRNPVTTFYRSYINSRHLVI